MLENISAFHPDSASQKGVLYDTTFLLVAGIIAVVFYYESLALAERSAQVPQLILSIILSLIVLTIIFFNARSRLGQKFDIERYQRPLKRGLKTEMNMRRVIREFIIILSFSVIITFVGYFTTSFLYAYFYIFANTEATGRRKIIVPFIWAGVVTTIAYFVFIYIVGSVTIYRLGIFL